MYVCLFRKLRVLAKKVTSLFGYPLQVSTQAQLVPTTISYGFVWLGLHTVDFFNSLTIDKSREKNTVALVSKSVCPLVLFNHP